MTKCKWTIPLMNQETNLWLSIYRFACMHTITNRWIKHCTVPAREQGIAWVAKASNSLLIGRRWFNSTSSELPKSMYPTHNTIFRGICQNFSSIPLVVFCNTWRSVQKTSHLCVYIFFYSTAPNPFHCVRRSTMELCIWIKKKRKKNMKRKNV